MKKSPKWLVGIDEAGEKVWETFARGCLAFLEFTKEMLTTYTVPVRKGSSHYYGK